MSFQFSPFVPSTDESSSSSTDESSSSSTDETSSSTDESSSSSTDESSSSTDESNTTDESSDEIKPVCPKCPDIIPSHTHVESFSHFAPVRNYNWILFIVLIYMIGCMMLLSKPSLYKKMNRKYNIVVILIIGPFYAIYKYLSCM